MKRLAGLAIVACFGTASPALAQGMSGMDHSSMPGMKMPATKPTAQPRKTATPAARAKPAKRVHRAPAKPSAPTPPPASDMTGMDHSSMPGMDMSGDKPGTASPSMSGMAIDHSAMPGMAPTGTDLPAGNAPAPAPPMDHYATRIFPATEIERSHRQMMNESGAETFAFVMFNLAEYQPRRGHDGFRWDGEGWYGGDINRLTIKTEGEGRFGEGVADAEVQALYSRAIDPYFNAQIGIRQDLGRGARRTYATVGFEGLAPYWFEVEGALFLSDKGDLLGRLEGYYDQRITQRLVLQPRVELNLTAQDVPASRIGAGLSTAEIGLRLRYEIKRQFAPYIGVSWERKIGQTGRYARADGEDVESKGLVAGIRFWF
jgi:copper resistance protein B